MKKNMLIIVLLLIVAFFFVYSRIKSSEASLNMALAEAAQEEATQNAKRADMQGQLAKDKAAEAIRMQAELVLTKAALQECQSGK